MATMQITLKTIEKLRTVLSGIEAMNVEACIYRQAFDLVKPATDWRAAINSELHEGQIQAAGLTVEVVAKAIEFMTATPASVERKGSMVQFRAKGYRMGPAGDH